MKRARDRRGVLLALALVACEASPPAPIAAPAAAIAAPARTDEGRVLAMRTAEQRRLASDVTVDDLASRTLEVRRAAARALARIGGAASRTGLVRTLADEDDEVAAFGAYGLGSSCRGHEEENVSALVAAAIARFPPSKAPLPADAPPNAVDPFAAFARAIGTCAADASEPTLVAWLEGPRERAVASALALGNLASVRQKLREETIVALLHRAAGNATSPPLPEALHAIGRLENVPPTVVERIRQVAAARLAEPGPARVFAVKALGRAGDDAAPDLARVLTTAGAFSAPERVEAAKALKRIGPAGARVLGESLASLVPTSDAVALGGLAGDDLGVLLTALDSLTEPGAAKRALGELAALALPPAAPASVLRRLAWVRCSAAKVLAGANEREPLLLACDVSEDVSEAPAGVVRGSIGQRAVVAVLGRGRITGARLATFKAYAEGGDLRAREAAIELLGPHDEIVGGATILAAALAAPETGLVATAADVIAKHPQRAGDDAKRGKKRRGRKGEDDEPTVFAPSAAVVQALRTALSSPAALEDLEMQSALVDAAGALALTDVQPRLEELCRSSYPTAREHAAAALALLGGKKVTCDPPAEGGEAPAELAAPLAGPTTLAFDTDAGALTVTLDPALAPVAAARIVSLARKGYYDGNIVHRVAAGFVTQLGAPHGDGYGGPGPPLRCETSPVPFAPLTVGVALAGRDTGSSQIFVMHSRAPHLDGGYAWLGTATGDWAALVDGDRVRKVTVTP